MRVKAISLNPRCRIWRVSKRKSNRLNLSFQAKVRSMVNRSLYSTASKNRLRPRFGFFRFRGFSLIFGFMPALKTTLRLALLSKPASRFSIAPANLRSASRATRLRSFNPSGSNTLSVWLTGATVRGARTLPRLSAIAMTFSPVWCL
jgi:hypothetical protein